MAYALYKKGIKIRKIQGNPRSPSNQRNLVVWDRTAKGVKGWIKEWGTQKQKKQFLK